ncbi:hypothetical protein [Bathymodiolus japonicus methanotrophic gill symbiont]|uniref:hypothetical protein n=1 Tax=Bathymodiolus japonicus methanotrophic gill symbiont TaxID=113269 RepID=UPI001C8E5C32|nr:hypothetical protein [Bathymodiolus japonicus methanotrophic gill symbiont]
MTSKNHSVSYNVHLLSYFDVITINKSQEGRTLMGAILDVTEMLKEPEGMAIAAVVIAAGYFFVKWVFAEHEDDE